MNYQAVAGDGEWGEILVKQAPSESGRRMWSLFKRRRVGVIYPLTLTVTLEFYVPPSPVL